MEKDFNHENPENWKWGIIYFNKGDHRFVVPKRNPMMGWTFNFAHRISLIILTAIVLLALAPLFF